MNFCLSDLVPPLRWSDTSTITLLTGQPGLPDAWWRSLPMPRVLAAIGPESLGELLTEIAIEHWPAAAVGDVLPALHMLDPDEADEPHVAIALDRAGSWPGLLALTSRELRDQPFVQARPVLTALFSAALVRLSPSSGAALGEGTARPLVRESAGEPASLLAEQPVDEPAPLPHSATPPGNSPPVDSAAENDLQGDPAQKDRTPHGDLALDEDRTPRSDLAPPSGTMRLTRPSAATRTGRLAGTAPQKRAPARTALPRRTGRLARGSAPMRTAPPAKSTTSRPVRTATPPMTSDPRRRSPRPTGSSPP
ncbi:hypothetical protein ACFSTC_05410 [Nonomuraea ferruginea]